MKFQETKGFEHFGKQPKNAALERFLEEYAEKSEHIDECVALSKTTKVDYTVSDEKQDRRELMFATAGKFIKLYGPPATLMVVSIGCTLGAHHIMKKRNVALMAAYKLIEEAFSKYRKRVVDEIGEQADDRFFYGAEITEDSPTLKVTDKDGKEHELNIANHHCSVKYFLKKAPRT